MTNCSIRRVECRLHGGRPGAVEVVVLERLPAPAHALAQPSGGRARTVPRARRACRDRVVPGRRRGPRRIGEPARTAPGRALSTSTSRDSRSPRSAAKRAAIAPPNAYPTRAGGAGQVPSIRSPSQVSTRSASSAPSSTSELPCPGRSGATTRLVSASCGSTRAQCTALPPGPCRSTSGGPSPACTYGRRHACQQHLVLGRSGRPTAGAYEVRSRSRSSAADRDGRPGAGASGESPNLSHPRRG